MGSGLAAFAGQVVHIHESERTMGTDQAPPKGRKDPGREGLQPCRRWC